MAVMSEEDRELEARLAEEDAFEPADSFVEQANVSDPQHLPGFRRRMARLLGPGSRPTRVGHRLRAGTGRLESAVL